MNKQQLYAIEQLLIKIKKQDKKQKSN